MEIMLEKCLRELLVKQGKTQSDLAEHLSISTQAVSKWCHGENMPDIILLPKIASFLDVSVDELLGVGEIRKQEKMFSAPTDVSGGHSRRLTEEEQKRYDDLVKRYEEGLYVAAEITVIQQPEEYTGVGVAICVADSTYYIPENELSDEELLQIIDFDHKAAYSINKIGYEVQLGLRDHYPGH